MRSHRGRKLYRATVHTQLLTSPRIASPFAIRMLLAFRLRNESRRAHAGGRALRACGRMKLLGWLHGAGSASASVVGQRTRTPDPDFALGLRSPPHYFWCHVGNGIVNAPRKVPLSLRGAPPLRGGFLFLRSKTQDTSLLICFRYARALAAMAAPVTLSHLSDSKVRCSR